MTIVASVRYSQQVTDDGWDYMLATRVFNQDTPLDAVMRWAQSHNPRGNVTLTVDEGEEGRKG